MLLRLKNISGYAFVPIMVTDTIEQLRRALKMPGFTKKGLAELAGLHPNTLLGCELDDWNPTANTLRAIEPHLPRAEQAA
jgi:hypothetical protein